MDSRRWLIGLAAIAAVLAALLAVDVLVPGEAAAPAGGRIVPAWDARRVRSIRISRAGEPEMVLERVQPPGAPGSPAAGLGANPAAPAATARSVAEEWTLHVPSSGAASIPVDPAAVRELFGTIETLSAIRRDPGSIEAPHLALSIELETGPVVRLLVAEAGPSQTDRVWLARPGEPGRFLVDGYAARALDVSATQLREVRPFRGRLDGATRIEIAAGRGTSVLTGPPWTIHLSGGAARAAPERVQALFDWAGRLRIQSSGPGQPGEPLARVAIESPTGRAAVEYRGTCPGDAFWADTPIGPGCLPGRDGLTELAGAPEDWVDRDLVGGPVDRIARLHIERAGRAIDVTRADQAEPLRDWLSRWREAAAGPLVPVDRLGPIVAAVSLAREEPNPGDGEAERDGDRIAIHRTADGQLAAWRRGEPVALILHPWADAHLDPSPYRFRSLDLLAADPSALAAAAARRGGRIVDAIERGDTLEEWRPAAAKAGAVPAAGAGAKAGAVSAAAAFALRQAVGPLRAERFVAATAEPRHGLAPPRRAVELTFDAAPGAAGGERHTVEIGAAASDGCYARLDGDPAVFELSRARCAALLAPWTAPRREAGAGIEKGPSDGPP